MRRIVVVFLMFAVLVIALGGPLFAQMNRPVTFTQAGWANQGQNLIYSSWRYAFSHFSFYGFVRQNWLYAGGRLTMSVEGSRSALSNLIRWLPQTGTPRALTTTQDFVTPAPLPQGNTLATAVVALTMNVAFNDMRLMPRSPGYDLEKFTIRVGAMRGRTVGQVLDIANRILGGDAPARYGFANYQGIADVVRGINSNYEFISYTSVVDRGYLVPNRPFGRPDPPHDPHVP